jgi:hypothetical protein
VSLVYHSFAFRDFYADAVVAGSAFEAGTDTVAATLLWFFIAMALHPETLEKAQAEVDALLGHDGDTIPTFSHIDDLPYCVALTKEVFRFGCYFTVRDYHYRSKTSQMVSRSSWWVPAPRRWR